MKKEDLLTIILLWCVMIMLSIVVYTTDKESRSVFTITKNEEVVTKQNLPEIKEIQERRFVDHGLMINEESEKEVVPEEPVEVVQEEIVEEVVEEIVIQDIPYQWQPIDSNFNVFQPSYLNREELLYALGDIRSGLHSSVDSIILAEETYGVNALYLASVLGYESGWGVYENGWNNIAGWKGNYGNFSDFSSRHECIMTVAEGLTTNFQPDVGNRIADVAARYCPDYGYLNTLLQIMGELDYYL